MYKKLWTCRYQSPLQSFCLLHLCDILIRYDAAPLSVQEILRFCMETLKESADGRGGNAVCGPLQKALCQTAVECNVLSPRDAHEWLGAADNLRADDMLDAITRLSYTQPVDEAVSKMDPALARDFTEGWRLFVENGGSDLGQAGDRSEYLRISSLLNG